MARGTLAGAIGQGTGWEAGIRRAPTHENVNRLTNKWVRPLTDILCAVPIIAGIVFLV
jgi:hypothetical protein